MKRQHDRSFVVLLTLVILLYWTVLLQWWEAIPATPANLDHASPSRRDSSKARKIERDFRDDIRLQLEQESTSTADEIEEYNSRGTVNDVNEEPPFSQYNSQNVSMDGETNLDEQWAGSEVIVHDEEDFLSAKDTATARSATAVRRFGYKRKSNARYFFYQPSGGFGNQRLILRWAMIVANAMNRTLAVAPLAPHSDIWHGYNRWRKEDIIPAYKVLDARALNEALNRGVVFLDDVPARVIDRVMNYSSYSVKTHVKGHYVNRDAVKKKLLVYRESEIAEMWRSVQDDIVFWDKMSMWQCCSPDFGPDSVWYGRHIMFNTEFKSLAKQLMADVGEYNAVHVRRGDMTISRDRRTAEVYYKSHRLERFDKNLPLYIATNEKDKSWFDALKEPKRFTRLLFWDDLDKEAIERILSKHPEAMKGDVLGFIDLLICGNAVMWEGSRKSTFSASISSIRMASQLRTLEWSFPPKPSVRKVLTLRSTDDHIPEDDIGDDDIAA
jgi:hypothetical protein